MKLRYQMRGLGIGMIVTALLMGVAAGEKLPLSDAEIRAKALELGMVESDSLRLTDLQNVQPSSAPPSTPQPSSQGTGQENEDDIPHSGSGSDEESNSHNSESGPDEGGQDSENSTDAPTGSSEPGSQGNREQNPGTENGPGNEGSSEPGDGAGNAGPDTGDAVTVVIESGMDSYSVCRMLAEAGLVEDASVFDDYIYELGYSRNIKAGTYEITAGTSEEEIAKIIIGYR